MPPHRISFLGALTGAALSCSLLAAQEPAPHVRIVAPIDESHLVRLAGNTHPYARAQYDRGRVSPDLRMDDLILVLERSPEQQDAFDKFVASQSDPGSQNYHRWLEPGEVGERFGPAESDIDTIRRWLEGKGLNVGEVSPDRMSIHFGGTARQVEAAFHTEIHNLDVNGVSHIANMSDPLIPAALAPVVVGPKQLHNFQPHPLYKLGNKVTFDRAMGRWNRIEDESAAASNDRARPRPLFGINDPNNGLVEDVAPYDFATVYNVLPLWNKGIDGTGQTIAIAGTSEIDENDLTTFRSDFGLPPIKSFRQVIANGYNPGQCGADPTSYCTLSDQIENSLDVEWSGAVAKGASIVLAVSGLNSAGTNDTVYDSANWVIANKQASILNVSYGLCELFEGTAGNTSYNNLWQTAYSEGIAVFVATGDSGSATCDGAVDPGAPYVAEYGLSVSGIASTPYDTAVGGTDFNWGSTASPYWNSSNNSTTKANALGYVPEVAWNDSCASPFVISYLDNTVAPQVDSYYGLTAPGDAEEACNYIIAYYNDSGDTSLNGFVDTSGGSGGKSTCTVNNTTSSTTTPNPGSCQGGYPKPSWQTGVYGMVNDGRRDIPDVAFFASNGFLGSALIICESPGNSEGCTYSATSENVYQEIGGTSGAAPAMAGVMALINQKEGYSQGNPNAELYSLAARESYGSCSAEHVTTSSVCLFNDIDTTNNTQPCDWGLNGSDSPDCQDIHSDPIGTLEGYDAVHGYDLVTGLGSLNVANVVDSWQPEAVPEVSLSSSTVTFVSTGVGTTSAAQTVTLQNTGHGSLALNAKGDGITLSGTDAKSFSETNNCGASVAIGGKCTITLVFKPASTGTLTATLTVADNALGSPQSVALTGTGVQPQIRLSAATLTFANTGVGKPSYNQTVTVRNPGSAALKLTSVSITGTDAHSFLETNTCGSAIAAGKSCTITLTFKPAAMGKQTADLVLTDNASGSPQKIALTGTGLEAIASLSATSLSFPATTVGDKAATQTITLTNKGNKTLGKPGGGSMVSITGLNYLCFSQTNTCSSGGVAAGGKCTITVTFDPRKTGALSASLTLTDNEPGSPQTVKLSGTGK